MTAALVCLLIGPLFPAYAADGTDGTGGEELGSNRYTQVLDEDAPVEGYGLEGFTPLMENDMLGVYYRSSVGAIRVLDKRSGYVWGTMREDKPENLNERWAAIANSVVMAEVYDSEDKLSSSGAAGAQLQCTVSGKTAVMDVYWQDWQLGFTFEMTLADNALSFSLRDSSIREEGAYRLASVTFAPFFGATEGNTVPGYLFVPDGCGALMRFMSPRNYLQGYEKRIYGADYGIDPLDVSAQGSARDEETASMPVFGITHGERQNAFLAVAGQGEEYGLIKADPAGIICDYNRANIKFVYRQMYEQPVSRVGVGVQTVQPERNRVDPQISYYFLTGEDAGYVGMAKQYRTLLTENGTLVRGVFGEATPLRVDFLAADIQKEFIGSSVNVTTSLDLVRQAREELCAAGVKNLQIGLVGWQKGGANGYRKTDVRQNTVYGGLGALERADGEAVWLSLTPFSAREGQFEQRSEGGISLSQSLIVKKGEEDAYLGDIYYLKPQKALEALLAQTERLSESGNSAFVLGDIGQLLYGEYLSGNRMTRSEVRARVEETARTLAEQYGPLTLTRPNAYLFGVTGVYDHTPMVSSQFLYETDTVPFLQIVLSGSVEMVAPYANLSFFSEMDRLKMIDYNTCPSYLLTEKENYEMRNTASANLCSTRYEDWRGHIVQTYAQVSAILDHTRGQMLEDRFVLEQGLVKNVYEHGCVYVNYNACAKRADGIEIGAYSAVYVEGGA